MYYVEYAADFDRSNAFNADDIILEIYPQIYICKDVAYNINAYNIIIIIHSINGVPKLYYILLLF